MHAYKVESTEKREQQDWLAKAAIEAGQEIPAEALDNSPDLRHDLEFYLQAYRDLSTVRPVAFAGMAPLPYKEIIYYSTIHELDDEESEDFFEIIMELDRQFREFLESQKSDEANEHDRTSNTNHNRPRDANRRGKGRK